MKEFNRARKLNEIIKLAEEKGFEVDKREFKQGGDWIWLRDMDGRMVQIKFNTFNGWFYIYTPASGNKPWATHMSSELDDNPLYSEILELLYVGEVESLIEILARNMDDYFKRSGIKAVKTYQGDINGGSPYQVWELTTDEFKKLNETKDESYQLYEYWRQSDGSNMGGVERRYKINGHYIKAWDGEYRKQAEEENKTLAVWDRYTTERAYGRLTEYFCDELGASVERNVCALAVDLAKQNNMTMAELFSKYEKSEVKENKR